MEYVPNGIDIDDLHRADSTLEARIAELEAKVKEYDLIIERVGEAMNMAKQNPMVANMLRMLGIE